MSSHHRYTFTHGTYQGNLFIQQIYNYAHLSWMTVYVPDICTHLHACQAFEGRAKEGLVQTACACAEVSRKSYVKIGSHVHGKALQMKYMEIHVQSIIWVALVRSSVRPSKKDRKLDSNGPLETSFHIVSPSNASKASLPITNLL